MAPSILVVGAGELGTAVLEALSKHPKRERRISVLLRPQSIASSDPTKQESNNHIKSLGVDFEPGDFANSSTSELAGIFKKFDVVIQCAGYGMAPGIQTKVTEAILEAGVPRYFPWQFGVDYDVIGEGSAQDLFDEQLGVRKQLRAQSKVAWTIVSTGMFMSYLFLQGFGVVDLEQRVVTALGGWENRVTVTTPQDIGTMIAEIVYVPGDTASKVVYIGGDTVTYGQLADILDAAFGTRFRRQVLETTTIQQVLRDTPDDLWLKYQAIFADGTGVSWDKERCLNTERHVALTSVEKYVSEHKNELGKSA